MTSPTEHLAALLGTGTPDPEPFGSASRYRGLPLGTTVVSGTPVRYVRRRTVPQPDAFTTLRERVVADDDRPDTLAASELGDPELFWQLADANGAVHPDDLVAEVGRRLRTPLPLGVPGPAGAT